MPDVIDELLAQPGVRRAAPASMQQIEQVEQWYQAELPPTLARLWIASDGVALDPIGGDILGATDLLNFAANPAGQWMVERSFVPILFDRQADYLGMLIRPPLAYRSVYLAHDDAIPRLRYREPESCLRALLDAVRRGQGAWSLMVENPGDYAGDAARPVEDQIAARELMATDNGHEEWYYAIQLLDETNYDAWEKMLATPDPFVRAQVTARMAKLQSIDLQALLAKDQAALSQFVTQVLQSAREAGLAIEMRDGSAVLIGQNWVYLEAFYPRRAIPNAIPRLVTWLQDQADGRNPEDRPGNFMAD